MIAGDRLPAFPIIRSGAAGPLQPRRASRPWGLRVQATPGAIAGSLNACDVHDPAERLAAATDLRVATRVGNHAAWGYLVPHRFGGRPIVNQVPDRRDRQQQFEHADAAPMATAAAALAPRPLLSSTSSLNFSIGVKLKRFSDFH